MVPQHAAVIWNFSACRAEIHEVYVRLRTQEQVGEQRIRMSAQQWIRPMTRVHRVPEKCSLRQLSVSSPGGEVKQPEGPSTDATSGKRIPGDVLAGSKMLALWSQKTGTGWR